jgi:hypothetical protein
MTAETHTQGDRIRARWRDAKQRAARLKTSPPTRRETK